MSRDVAAGLTVLVLAGQRQGGADPLASAKGVAFKAMTPVAGRPMILHTLDAIASSPRVGTIVVSINAGSGLEALPEISALVRQNRLKILASRPNLVDSVLDALAGVSFPALVTTADNVLITPGSIAEIDEGARRDGAEVAIALARREDVLAAHPDGQRRFYRFADGYYSNCNSYWIGEPSALALAELFRSGGQFVKHPWRVVRMLGFAGVLELARFRLGIGTLADGCRRLSRRFGVIVRPIILSDGAAAIDVDAERSLRVAEEVMAMRRANTTGEVRQAAC